MRREWYPDEVDYMYKAYLRQPVCKTAAYLDRSVESVKKKAETLGLNHYTTNLNAKTIAKCFGVDYSVVKNWVKKYRLPAIYVKCSNQTRIVIKAEKFWKWANNHKDMINWSRYEIGSIPPEPEWVVDTKRNYKTVKSRQRFTPEEILRIKSYLRTDMNYQSIADEMGRSLYSIRHVCRDIYTR